MESKSQSTLPDIRHIATFNAPIQRVWNAIATSEGIAAWFMPNDFQPVVGHAFHLDAGPYGMSPCQVTAIDPPNRLSFRWGQDWTVTFALAERDGKTEFTVIHSGWDADKVTEFGDPFRVVRDRMDSGWGGLTRSLAKYVEA